MEGQLDNGLIIGHAYSITDVRYVSTSVPGDSVKCSQLVYRDVHSYHVVKHVVAQITPFNSLWPTTVCRRQVAGAMIGCFK